MTDRTKRKERPILFTGEMVRAIIEGRKTQTRRVVKPQPPEGGDVVKIGSDGTRTFWEARFDESYHRRRLEEFACPYGQPGDRLYVRETWRYHDWTEDGLPRIEYRADGDVRWMDYGDIPEEWCDRLVETWTDLSDPDNFARHGRAADPFWRPSIFMPKWASRLWLEVTDVRVERVQEISYGDVSAEGLIVSRQNGEGGAAHAIRTIHAFRDLWDSINADGGYGWNVNPWVWVVEFRRVER